MSKSTSGGIGLGTIIFWAFLAWMFFSDGESDKTEVEVKPQDETQISDHLKNAANEVKEGTKLIIEKAKKELETASTTSTTEKKEPINEQKETEQVEVPKVEETTRSIEEEETKKSENQEEAEGFRKLENLESDGDGLKKL